MTHTLIYNGTLLDGNGGAPVANGAVLIEGNRIVGVGPLTALAVPPEVTRIDAGGGTIMPGLIDAHVHIKMQMDDIRVTMMTPFSFHFYQSVHYLRATVNAGITAVRDAGGADLGMKQAVDQGVVVGPRIMLSITALGITGGHGDDWLPSGGSWSTGVYPGMPDGICDGVDGVRKKAREVLRAGAEVIKVCATGGVLSPTDHPEFTQFTIEELEAIVQEGQFRRGVRVMAHAQGAEGIKNAILAGIHSIEHGIYLTDEVIDLMLQYGTYLVPTLLAPVSVVEIGESKGTMPEYGVRKAKETIQIHKDSIARAYEAGVKIAMGTDAGVMPHGTNLRELGLMYDIGMTPMEVLLATTKVAAECMGWEDRIGTLEVGKLADVTVSRTDPLADIRSLENNDNIVLVLKDGMVVKNVL